MKGEELEEKTNEIAREVYMTYLGTFPKQKTKPKKEKEMIEAMKDKIREKLKEV